MEKFIHLEVGAAAEIHISSGMKIILLDNQITDTGGWMKWVFKHQDLQVLRL